MAKIHEERIVIKLSKLVKGEEKSNSIVGVELVTSLEQALQELVGDGVIVEVEAIE